MNLRHKSFSHKKHKQQPHSKTSVNTTRKTGVGIWNGKRKVVGIRVDETLYLAFKPIAQHVFGSVCRPIEAFMASVIAMAEDGVNFGNTLKIEGGLHVERNLKPRRSLVVDRELGNFYNGNMWDRVDGPFNDNGHGVGCKCRVCR